MPDPIDPVPAAALPAFAAGGSVPPAMPAAWSATVLLHPFAPPPEGSAPDDPFAALGIATVDYAAGAYLSARVAGGWWYVVTPGGTRVSRDRGATWTAVDLGWSLPADWYGAAAATARCAGASPLNWLSPRPAEWWTIKVPLPGAGPPGATWLWFDQASGDPLRLMFGVSPPAPATGDPTCLAFFQMFSLTCFAAFTRHAVAPALPAAWAEPAIPGLARGNPHGYKPFAWSRNSALTAFSTPVNGDYDPLPSRTLYVWKDDADYKVYTDRAQSTLMHYTYNPDPPPGQKPVATVTSLLTGAAPAPTPHAGTGFLHTRFADGTEACVTGGAFDFGQEPPRWVSIPGVKGTIAATISDNAVLCPGAVVTVYSVLFPPNDKYPGGTYLWTWYSPETGSDGTRSRPAVFMQSDAGVNVGTSLALADYFDYRDLAEPIDPANFTIPACCLTPGD